jgi:probable F420-dependent oxidoreductase
VKVGIVPVNAGPYLAPGFLARFAKAAEDLGYESLWTFEHVIVPEHYESVYPYSPTGKLAVVHSAAFVDPLVAIAWCAAATERLNFGTGVNILTQANPLYLAKQASSIDHLSGGRLLLGLGVGWLKEEFDALGVPFGRRGERADAYLDAMRTAWSGDDVDVRNEFVNWHGWQMQPPPASRVDGRPSVPILIGGTSPAAIRRVVSRGDGWYVIHRDLDHFDELMAALGRECDRQDRDPTTLDITAYWNHHREGLDGAERYRRAGVTRLIVNAQALRMGSTLEAIERFATEVLPQL